MFEAIRQLTNENVKKNKNKEDKKKWLDDNQVLLRSEHLEAQ